MNYAIFDSTLQYIGFFVSFIISYLLINKLIKSRYLQIKIILLYVIYINKIKKEICNSIRNFIALLLKDKLKSFILLEQSEIANKIKNNILELEKNNLEIEEELYKNEIIENNTIKYLVSNYFILKDYIYRTFKDYNDEYYELAKKYQNDITRIYSFKELYKIKRNIGENIKIINKNYQEFIKQSIDEKKNQEFGKIKIEFSTINELIKIVPILLLLGGFLYNYFLFKTLGINISNFFTITDYIESSLDVIVPLLWVTGFQAILTIMGYFNQIDKTIKESQFNISYSQKDSNFEKILYFLFALLVILQIILYYKEHIIHYAIMQPITLFISYVLLEKKFPFKRVDNSHKIYMFSMIVIFFIISLTYHILEEIDNVTNNKIKKSLYTFSIKDNLNLSSYQYIKSTSNYSFFYNYGNNETMILKNSDIEKIQIHKDKKSIFSISIGNEIK